MGRLLKEVPFGSGVLFTFEGQAIVIKVKRSTYSDSTVKLIIEAPPEVIITDDPGNKNRQDG